MGPLFVLIFYAVALTIAASVCAVILGGTTFLLLRNSGPKRERAVLLSVVFPFACVAFAGGWFIAYALINTTVFHRDPGIGDDWETPLPNGFAIRMIDTTDQGEIYNPRTQPIESGLGDKQDEVFGVRRVQVAGDRVFGASDSGWFGHFGHDSSFVDNYFELNAGNGTLTKFKSLDELRLHAASEGVSLHLRDIDSVYRDYRFTWFDYAAGAILLLVPLTGFLALARYISRGRALPTAPTSSDG
jgi:hypothetical protein